jgi:hypothetical protein
MKKTNAQVFIENRYAEFTTMFRIQFQDNTKGEPLRSSHIWKDLLGSWAPICIAALEARMESCISMLFRNRNNILLANDVQVVYRKSNGQVHAFNHPSYQAMETMVELLKQGSWEEIKNNEVGVRQLLKALYWIPEENKKDQGGFGFGQLISCLEEFTFGFNKL